MWIFCGGMYRSGSTVQFQITADLVEKFGIGKRIEWDNLHDFKKLKNKYNRYQKLKIFKTHVCSDDIAHEFHNFKAKGVYIFRDIRDVFVSSMKKNSRSFKELWEQNFLEHCLDEFQKWINMPRILISKYEDVIDDLTMEVKRIADHIEIKINHIVAEEIASNYSIEKQLERVKKINKISNKTIFDPISLLHNNHIFSGKTRQWESELTREDILLIEKQSNIWLKKNGYELSKYT
jgi:Sulfotransferase domain